MSEERDLSRAGLIEENRRLRAMVELSGTLADSRLRLEAKLQACVETLARMAGAEQASLMMVEGEDLVVRAATNPDIVGLGTPLSQSSISTDVVSSGRGVHLKDVATSDYASARRHGDRSTYRTNSLICLPLCDAGQTAGVLNLSDKMGADAFDRHDFELAGSIAEQVSSLVYFSALHSKLVGAFNQLDGATKVKDDLMFLIFHGMCTPLGVAREMVQQLMSEPEDVEDQRRCLDVAAGELELLWRRITNMMDLGRMDAAGAKVETKALGIGATARAARGALAAMARAKGVKVWLEASGDPKVKAESKLAERITANLLLNALAASAPEAGGRGEVFMVVVVEDQRSRIDVIDSGGGIDDEKAAHLFSRRPHGGMAERGVGVGLYFSRRAARMMGGDVTWQNLPQGGARFSLSLPSVGGG